MFGSEYFEGLGGTKPTNSHSGVSVWQFDYSGLHGVADVVYCYLAASAEPVGGGKRQGFTAFVHQQRCVSVGFFERR